MVTFQKQWYTEQEYIKLLKKKDKKKKKSIVHVKFKSQLFLLIQLQLLITYIFFILVHHYKERKTCVSMIIRRL